MSPAPQDEPAVTQTTPTGLSALSPAASTPSTGIIAGVRTGTAADVALVSTFAAFIAVCAIFAFPVGGMAVPITLQTFGVLLAGVVLGARRGALAVALYLAVGLAGLPVFAQGTGGLAVIAKPSFGYLIAFPIAAALAGYVATSARRVRPALRPAVLFGAAMAGLVVVIYPIGIAVMGWRLNLEPGAAIAIASAFFPGDLLKNVLVAVVGAAIFRAFPDMLRNRR